MPLLPGWWSESSSREDGRENDPFFNRQPKETIANIRPGTVADRFGIGSVESLLARSSGCTIST